MIRAVDSHGVTWAVVLGGFEVTSRRIETGGVAHAKLQVDRRGDAHQIGDFVVADRAAEIVRGFDVEVDLRGVTHVLEAVAQLVGAAQRRSIALTRMPCGPQSNARRRVIPTSPDLAASRAMVTVWSAGAS